MDTQYYRGGQLVEFREPYVRQEPDVYETKYLFLASYISSSDYSSLISAGHEPPSVPVHGQPRVRLKYLNTNVIHVCAFDEQFV